MEPNPTIEKALTTLRAELHVKRREARREYKCHFGAANICRKRHFIFGGIASLSALVAGSGFVVRLSGVIPHLDMITSALSLLAAALTGLITFNRFMETAEKHYASGRLWEDYRDRVSALLIEIEGAFTETDLSRILKKYEELAGRRTKIRKESISYPDWLFRKYEFIQDKIELEPLQMT